MAYNKKDYNNKYYYNMDAGVNFNPISIIHAEDILSAICGTNILSIGCGTGIMEYRLMQKRPDFKITGTDFKKTRMQKRLWKKYQLHVEIADGTRQPFPNESFETVYTSHVLEHVPDPKAVILESIRLASKCAFHLIPINLDNPDHINFFKFASIDNEYRAQEATIDLKELADEIIRETRHIYPEIKYELSISCARDGSRDYGDMEFPVKRVDRPDGLMPCFLIKFIK